MPDWEDDLRQAMRQWATGVSLVTARHRGQPRGMTVNSFTSLSLEPPMVMVALRIGSRTEEWARRGRGFALSILAQHQRALAERFAAQEGSQSDRFAPFRWHATPSGHPVPADCLAWLDCQVRQLRRAGTHRLVIAGALSARLGRPARPLLYFRQGYHGIGHEPI